MNARFFQIGLLRIGNWPHFLLAGHLLMLHALAFGGWRVPAVRLLWVVALGLFLIWQPFVAGERRISMGQGAVLLVVALGSTALLEPWLLLIWCGALAAAIGGRVVATGSRTERIGYLLAFGYLIVVTVLGVVPELAAAVQVSAELRGVVARFLPMVLPVLLFFPAQAPQRRTGESFDLFYGLLVFLILAVFVLGALAYMLIAGGDYVESLFKTSMLMSCALLIVAWAWNPRGGFSGIGSAISRYLLSLGMPLEQWLVQLSAESERHTDPEQFLSAMMQRLMSLHWVTGSDWLAGDRNGRVGSLSSHSHRVLIHDVTLTLYFRHAPSPAMCWHVEWLLQLAAEFYLVKRQSRQLQRMGYIQAIHETGARVTHDVKNLLQSLQGLCYAASQPGDPNAVAALLGRQLPQIAERLKVTLDKLQSPQIDETEWTDATSWWRTLMDRYAAAQLEYRGGADEGQVIPAGLYDSVAENLLQNALAKRQREPGLAIVVGFFDGILTVRDDGSALSAGLAACLFREPVPSDDGLGVGLYQAAQHAEALGYCLRLDENRVGSVSFSLSSRQEAN